jgi:PAS domain S-box-containing protein
VSSSSIRPGARSWGGAELEIRGRNWFTDFHPPEHVDSLVAGYRRLMAEGDAQPLDYTENEILTSNGTRRLLRWHHVLQHDESGRPSGLLSSGDDITELRQLERMATRRQRLESIGTLAGGIAHDLNNALSPAVMGMGLLREAAPREGPLLDMIESSTKRAAQMVRQLLAFAKGAEGERRSIELPSIVREVERLVRITFPKNITVSIDLPSALPPIMGDATQMHQVLVNLAVNARDAMADGGLLAISAQVVEVNAEEASHVSLAAPRPGPFVRLTVRDTGEGIPAGLSDRIFDPFFTTKGPDRGTGLGLSTVLGIVKGHDGFLQVASRPGIGSAFHVYLPLPEAPMPVQSAMLREAERRHPSGAVLFVDDEPFIRSMATMLAHRVGYDATTVASTDEALAVLARSAASFTAVVTDLHMPGRDGLALAREVRERWPELPVVIVTGLMTDPLWQEVGGLSRVTVLPKPFSEQQLRSALERSTRPPEPPLESPLGA